MTSISGSDAVQALGGGTGSTAAPQPKNLIGADFNMFLKLLTTQMQNQDPLDPMDTSEYTQQLVQYSQVEQSLQQTTALKNILTRLSSQDMAQAANFIGREARFATPVAGLGSNTPATWSYALDRAPASMVAEIKDSTGKTIHTAPITAAKDGRFTWDGKLADGTRVKDGAYSLSVKALDASGANIPATINSIAIVKDVVSNGTDVLLGVNGIRLPMSSLIAISAVG